MLLYPFRWLRWLIASLLARIGRPPDYVTFLIEEEPPADVLSDDAIVDMLRKIGIDIARRTVAKYREGMNIPSSVQRRREKRALAAAGR